jgi:hypothetical protein
MEQFEAKIKELQREAMRSVEASVNELKQVLVVPIEAQGTLLGMALVSSLAKNNNNFESIPECLSAVAQRVRAVESRGQPNENNQLTMDTCPAESTRNLLIDLSKSQNQSHRESAQSIVKVVRSYVDGRWTRFLSQWVDATPSDKNGFFPLFALVSPGRRVCVCSGLRRSVGESLLHFVYAAHGVADAVDSSADELGHYVELFEALRASTSRGDVDDWRALWIQDVSQSDRATGERYIQRYRCLWPRGFNVQSSSRAASSQPEVSSPFQPEVAPPFQQEAEAPFQQEAEAPFQQEAPPPFQQEAPPPAQQEAPPPFQQSTPPPFTAPPSFQSLAPVQKQDEHDDFDEEVVEEPASTQSPYASSPPPAFRQNASAPPQMEQSESPPPFQFAAKTSSSPLSLPPPNYSPATNDSSSIVPSESLYPF